jgi:hypothetical protein
MSRGEGRLQRAVLGQLVVSESFLLLELMRRDLGHDPDHGERVPWYDAVKRLERDGKCTVVLESHLDSRGRQQKQKVVYRLGNAPDLSRDAALEVKESEPLRIRNVGPQAVAGVYEAGNSAEEWAAASAIAAAILDPTGWAAPSHGRLPKAVPEADYYAEVPGDIYDLIADWDAREDEANEYSRSNHTQGE